MIRRRIRAAGQAAVQPSFAPELWRVPRLRRRVDDVAFGGHNRARHISLERPAQRSEHYDPEFGEVGVEVPAVIWPHGLSRSRVAANQVPARPVLADRFLRPVLPPFVLLREIVHIDVDRPGLAAWIGNLERVWTGAETNRNYSEPGGAVAGRSGYTGVADASVTSKAIAGWSPTTSNPCSIRSGTKT